MGLMSALATGVNAHSITEVTATSLGQHSQVTVNVADLNLATPEGQQALHYRLSRAAEKVCGSANLRRAGSAGQAARNGDCHEQALSRAVSEVMSQAGTATVASIR
jgi:UrcA family protein